jgi:tRNA nucleotidyltransferase (CCA-adding enzyme)
VPRRDNKIGKGHKAFAVTLGDLTPEEAAARRDFTMNSLAYDPFERALIDPYGGVRDLEAGILRHTSAAFAEDPLRVLRGMQFAARFRLRLAPETAELSRSMLPEAAALPIERIFEEWRKWALKGVEPSAGLWVLSETGWIALYPELEAMRDCPQEIEWHPEGDVFTHTGHVCDAAAAIAERDGLGAEERMVLLFAALTHDLGKPATTEFIDGRLRSRGHAEAGVPLAEALLGRIGAWESITVRVLPLVREHLAHIALPLEPRAVRRLALRLEPASVEQWGRLVEADHHGRPPLPPEAPAQPYVDLARELAVEQGRPQMILMGRHLLAEGWSPGPAIGQALRAAYEAQIEGAFDTVEGGLEWIKAQGFEP